jgi:hypothetical protein
MSVLSQNGNRFVRHSKMEPFWEKNGLEITDRLDCIFTPSSQNDSQG